MSATPSVPPPPRPRRAWVHVLIALGVVLALAVLGAAWFIATPGGARLVLDRVATMLGEGTKFEGVEGSLASTLRVKSIHVTRPGLDVRIDDLVIERRPGSDWLGRVDLKRLEAAKVEVRSRSTSDAARLPLSFKPPYPVRVDDARIGELRWGALDPKASSPPDVIVKNLVLKGEGDERSWRVEQGGADTPYGHATLRGSLGTTPPFALDAKGELTGEREGHAYRAATGLRGTLTRIDADIEAEAEDLRAQGKALIEPFERDPVRTLSASMRAVDLARFARFPHTRLDIDATLHPAGGAVEGEARIVNADPGPLDRERLPVASAQGRVAWHRDAQGNAIVEWRDTVVAFAGGGRAQANGSWQGGRLEVRGRVADVDLARWDTRLKPTRLSGDVTAASDGSGQRFDVVLHEPRFDVAGRARLANARLDVETVRLKHESGLVEAKGSVELADRRAFRFEGRAEHFDPAKLVKGPPSDLNLTFVAAGTMKPQLAGDVKLDIGLSRWAGAPASGRIAVSVEPQRVRAADAHVVIGEARLDARGSFGRAGDALQVALHAPDIAVLAKPFGIAAAGRVDAEGTLTGTLAAPAGRVSLTGADLVLPSGWRAASLEARADVGVDAQSRIDVAADARGLGRTTSDGLTGYADRMQLAIQGTRAAHRIDVTAVQGKDQQLRIALQGGLDPRAPRPLWRGTLATLELTGPSAVTLASPATLVAAADRIELGEATLKGTWGEARFVTTRWTPAVIELRGTSPSILVREAARAARLQPLPRGRLVVSAQWDVRAAQSVEGTVAISRVSGDLRVGDPPRPIGLEQLNLQLEVRGGRAHAVALVAGPQIGRITADLTGSLQRVRSGFGIVPDAPLRGRIDADMPSIEWIATWMGPGARAEGRVAAHLDVAGTMNDPRFTGQVAGDDIKVREPQSGFEVENGVALLRVRDRNVVVEKLSASTPWHPSDDARKAMGHFAMPPSGTLSAEGAIDLAAHTGAIVIKAQSVPVNQLPRRFLALSGDARLEARAGGLVASGVFTADAGWIGALEKPLPSVSEDVVVVRAAKAPEERRPRERIRMDVRFSLGDHVWFSGRGLNTRLAGELRVTGDVGAGLRGTGAIRTVSGTYDAYGQQLAIDHGTLTFYGSLENPALNVLALRKGLPVEAGVEVLGTVARPRARLVSVPEVPDPEKISWLVLGRGPTDVSQGEASTLVAAANAILGRTSPGSQIAQRFGFDEVKVGRSDTSSALGTLPQSTVAGRTGTAAASEVVTVGKRLSKDVYVVYEQGLAEAEGALRITWQITQKFQMLLRAGYLPGVDAVYRWTFE